ncbi:hypothetical protein KGS77_24845 [Streptomyces sp. MST-110588]|nr:hypothetical protein KGS77_24845 [Streptomyces sp. MST-110588]
MNTSPSWSAAVPYITARRGEEAEITAMLGFRPGGGGLCYLDEGPGDRDDQGVLWARCSQSREDGWPVGSPRWGMVHPSRQRETMQGLRCQVCIVQPASRTASGYLFLSTRPKVTGRDWPEGVLTWQPPLCLGCAVIAVEQCHHLLRAGAVALRARVPRLYGVIGILYTTGTDLRPVPVQVSEEARDTPLPYKDHLLRPWFLASQLVRELRGVTVVDLEREIATARL